MAQVPEQSFEGRAELLRCYKMVDRTRQTPETDRQPILHTTQHGSSTCIPKIACRPAALSLRSAFKFYCRPTHLQPHLHPHTPSQDVNIGLFESHIQGGHPMAGLSAGGTRQVAALPPSVHAHAATAAVSDTQHSEGLAAAPSLTGVTPGVTSGVRG